MAEPYFTLVFASAVRDGTGFSSATWNADFFDSTGFHHRNRKGYLLERVNPDSPDPHHSPAAAALLAAATTEADVFEAVKVDAQRALAEFEARVTGGAVEPAAIVLFALPSPAPIDNEP